jgi:hypothetical protein
VPTNTTYFSIFASGGQGFNFTGVYNATTSYNPYDICTYNSSTFLCLVASTGNLPTNASYFICFALGLNFTGEHNGTTQYNINDLVFDSGSGSTYICISPSLGNGVSNSTYWSLVASQGATGPQGPTGATGDSGLDAFFTLLGLSGSISSSLITIASVNASLASMQAEIDGIQGEVSTLDSEVSTLQQQTQYQTATNTTSTTSFASDVVITDSTGLTTKVHLAQDGSITATGAISGTSITGSSNYSLGNLSTNTDTSYLDSNTVNVGTRHNATVNIGSGSSFSSINITGLTIALTGIVSINGVPFVNAGISFPSGINQGV